jgi:hypothetical protein
MSELDFNVSCWECCPYGYDPVSHCSRTFTDVALQSAELGQVIGAVILALFSYLLAANAQEVVRILRDSRTVRNKSTGMLTVFGLGAVHALSRIYSAGTVYTRYFLLLSGTPELPLSVVTTSSIMHVLGTQAMLSEVTFAILIQLRLLRTIRNPFKRYGSPFVQMAALGVSFGSSMAIGVLLGHSVGDFINSIVLGLQLMLLTYLVVFFGRALERALLQVDKTGSLQVDAVMRTAMTHHRQKLTPLGLMAILDIGVMMWLMRQPVVTQEFRTLNFFLVVVVPLTLEVLVNWVILNSLKKLARRPASAASVSPGNSRLKSATPSTISAG